MIKCLILLSNIYFLVITYTSADMNIIEDGKILESKPYSINEATLVVSKSNKIYICSISKDLTKCILSNRKNKVN